MWAPSVAAVCPLSASLACSSAGAVQEGALGATRGANMKQLQAGIQIQQQSKLMLKTQPPALLLAACTCQRAAATPFKGKACPLNDGFRHEQCMMCPSVRSFVGHMVGRTAQHTSAQHLGATACCLCPHSCWLCSDCVHVRCTQRFQEHMHSQNCPTLSD